MINLLMTPEAELDLAKVYESTFNEWGVQQAEKYQDEIYSGMNLLQEYPEAGKRYPFHGQGYRKLHINRHLIFYRVFKNEIVVTRILYDAMDIKIHLNE